MFSAIGCINFNLIISKKQNKFFYYNFTCKESHTILYTRFFNHCF